MTSPAMGWKRVCPLSAVLYASGFRGRSLSRLVCMAGLVAAVAAAVVVGAGGQAYAAHASGAAPVPSLTPAATNALWRRLAHGNRRLAGTASGDCRPLRVIFYAATDWRRLATKLAADASSCAQYYVSVPPLVADKTQERSGEA